MLLDIFWGMGSAMVVWILLEDWWDHRAVSNRSTDAGE